MTVTGARSLSSTEIHDVKQDDDFYNKLAQAPYVGRVRDGPLGGGGPGGAAVAQATWDRAMDRDPNLI